MESSCFWKNESSDSAMFDESWCTSTSSRLSMSIEMSSDRRSWIASIFIA